MPIDLKKIPKRLIDAVKHGNLVPLIGAGLSRQAKTRDSRAFPTWTHLLNELGEFGNTKGYITKKERSEIGGLVRRGKFLMAAQALKEIIPSDEFEAVLRERFYPADAKPGEVHKNLFKMKPHLIITTNYDMLLEDAYASEYKKSASSVTFKNAPEVQRFLQGHRTWVDRPLIFKIHGSVTFPAETVLAELDYRNLLYREPGYRTVLSAIFVTKVVLMLGFSFADPELTVLTESLRDSLKYRSSPDYIVLPKSKKGTIEKRRLRNDFGIEVIEYTSSEGHPEINKLVEFLAKFVPV